MIDKETVAKLAKLTRIELKDEEQASLVADLESILGYVSELSKVQSGTTDAVLEDNINCFREDDNAEESGIYPEKILADAPRTEKGYILVKQVIGEK